MTTTPPGWYDDGHGAMRWWDGAQWTEHVAQPDPETSPAPTEAEIVAEHDAAAAAQADAQAWPADRSTYAAWTDAATQPAAYPASQTGATGLPAQSGYLAAPQYPSAEGGQYAPAEGWPYPSGEAYSQGAYPGAAAGGAFTAATEPRKSKLWIVWVVLGVVLLGIVIAAAVLIPLLFLSATSAGSSPAQSDDERAAVATIERYDDAWQEGDCDAFTASTSDDFRTTSGFSDCSTFEADAEGFDENFDDYDVRVTAVETQGDEILVTTSETYTALVDENGEATDPTPGQTVYHYTLVPSGGDWVIDDLYYE